ncbi:LPXTG-motif cell wall anchor domain protein [Streptococcus mitis]|nr:LPXTG-motif cell wall anchor domain protein [Streptococcus mitis]
MIKKGKHFLFGCSLVFAVGASLATQVVHANTAETTVANNSTTGDVTPTPNGDGKTYEAPAAVAEIKSEVATTPAVAAKLDGETAKEVKALDKTKLENYIAEIEAKLANGTYESKTEESVAVLKADLEAAKATLANATTQDEITKAYNKLVTTANTKLKNKPVEKKETPAVDATNGQPTVGKKAENTEKKSESNSIENTGSNDSRNGKALDKNNAFRAEVAYSEGTNAAANGHSDTYILNDVNKATSTDDAVNAVSRVTNYKVKYNKDASGKITSLDWLVFYNDHAENLSNTYNTDGGDVYRNFIQIPAEVNMPTSITRAKYNSPIQGKLNPKTKKLERTKPDGSALSSSVTFENPAPATAAGLPLDKKDTFSLASGWESGIYGRSIEKLAGQEDRYFKSAASNSSPRTKELLDNVALNDKRLIVDRSTTGGSGYDGYAWSFRTEVPATTSNEQLKDMKVVFGMMRSATAGANAGFANIATNPIKMWQSDVSTPTAKDQTVKVGQKPDATKSIGNLDTLPKGTTVKYKDAVDTQTPGEKRATAVVTYPDTSTKEVPVKVIVEKEKEAVAPAKPVTPKPEAPKPSAPAPDAATNKPAAGAATNNPAATPTTSGPEIVNDLAGKASTPADVTIKAPAGSTVKLYNTDGVVIGEAVANDQGVATVHPTNSLPEGEITATSTPAGGTESAKSAPITVTKTPLTIIDGGVTGNNDTRLLVSKETITVYPGDKIDVDVVAQATALEKFSVEKNPTAIKGVLPSGGYLGSSNGATINQRDAKYSGTVAMDQPAGTNSIVFHASNRDKPTKIYRELKVIVLETAKKYEPVAGTKVDIADSNGVSETEKNKIIEAVKSANPSLPANSQYSVDEKGNLTITYPDGSKDKIAAAYLVNPATPVVAPTVEIPYSNKATKEVYVYGGEENSFDIKFKDDSGKIASATVKQGGNKAFADVAGEANTINTQYGFKANVINAETPATAEAPAVITYSGTPAATDGLAKDKLEAATKGENPEGMALGWRYATATDKDGAYIENGATNASNATDPGSFRVMLKGQTQKYDIATPTEKVTVADPANVTDADLAKIKEKLQLEYSQNNDDANLADKKGQAVADKDAKIQSVTKDDKGNLVVTYKDGSQDKKPLSEFVTKETTAVAPTVEIPYSNKATKEVYVYGGEENSFDIKFKDDSGKIASATVKQGGNKAFADVAGEANTINTQYGFKANVINAETPATAEAPAVITYSGTPAATDGLAKDKLEAATKGENPEGMALGWRYATATDKDGAFIENKAVGSSTATDPGAFRVMLKGQTQKYDIATPTEKVTVADPANVTDADLAKIKEKLQLEYSQNNDDANLADKKGQAVADKDAKIKSVEKDADGNLVVTYKDGSQDKKPLSEFVTKETTAVAPTVEIPYSNKDTKEVYVYGGEENSFDIKFKDDSGKIANATVKQGGNKAFADVAGEANTINTQYGFKANVINAETPATEKAPAVITYSGTPAATDGLSQDRLDAATKGENPEGMALGWRYATATDKDGAFIENKAVGSSTATDPGAFRVMLKGQTQKYDIATPTEKVTVADPANVTEAELAKIKEKVQLEYSQNNDDANFADKKGQAVADKDAKIQSVTKDDKGNLVVTYKDGSQDKKPLSEFVTKKPTDADKNESPSKPEIKTDLTGKAGTKTPVEVTATPGSKVELFDKDGNKIGEGVAGKDGKATITPTKELPAGDVTAKETTPAGKVSEASTPAKATPTKDTTTPSKPEIKTDLTGKAGTKTPVEVTATPGSKVELFDKDGNKIGEGVAGKDGKATITPTKELPAGDVTAKETTPAGKVSEASTPAKATPTKDTTTPSKPEIKTDLTGKAGTKTPVEVTATPGSKVELFDKDGNKIGEGVAGKDGKATITPTKELPAGDVTAKATDPAGNVSEPSTPEKATADTKAPAKPEIKTDLTDKAGTKTPVEVTAEPGSKVELFDKDGNKLGEGVADENGKATITPTKELPAGDVTAKATDPAGNVSEPSTPEKATADTKAPAKPEIKTDLTDKAGTKTPVEVTAEPGSKVELFDKDGNKLGEGVADENGKATITPTKELPAGDVTAKATDPAGNVSEPSTPEKATADTKAPAKPEIKTDLTDKAGTKTPVEVTAEPGSKVELFDKDGNKIGEGVAGKDGKATITPTKELPAGKVSEASTPAKATPTKDTTTPSKPEIKTDLTGKAGTKTPVEVTATPGSKVELFDKDGNKIGEGVAGKDGKATITPTKELPAGDVTAKATDPAGNVSEPSTPEKATADTKAPAKPEIKTDLTDKAGTKTPVEVTAEPGSKVELFDKDGNKLGEGVADENGKATITPTKELPAGDVTAKATDPAGNVSEPSVPATATKDTKAPAKPEVKTDLTDKAGTKTPVEVTAEPGSKVELFDKDGHKLGEGVADENGKATITPTKELPAGDVTAKATDPAGNVSEPSAPATATKDTKAPAKPAVTPVVDPSNLTEAEKAKVADEVKKSNPTVTDVKVGKDGTTTVTFPDGSTAVIPSGDTVKKSSDNAVKDPAVTPVVDPSNLTEAEKAKVADEVKKSNPTVTDVKVGKDGTTTVTFPDGSTAVIPSGDTVKKSSDNAVKDPAVTPVVDPSNLTEAEKAKVAEAVKKSNPTVTDVKVGKDGTATVTYPDGTTAVIPADKAVKKSNPTATDVKVGKDGTTAVIPANKADDKSKDADGVKDPSVTQVTDPSNLTDAEKAKVAEAVKKSNPTATDVKVGKDGTTTVTFPDGSTAVIPADKAVTSAEQGSHAVAPADKAVTSAEQGSHAATPAKKAGAKELPNTGTVDSTVAMVAAAASALLGLGLAGRRRKEDEEA